MLQVIFPGRFQPRISQVVEEQGVIAEGLKIELANGERVLRPMGLTDVPGGAATAGMYAIVFGAGFLLTAHCAACALWRPAAWASVSSAST